jgi:riboflavin kinase
MGLSAVENIIIIGGGSIFILSKRLVEEALELIVSRYGKKWNGKGAHKRLGKRPMESAVSLIHDYDLPCTP